MSTHVSDYVAANHTSFYANDTAAKVPASLSGIVAGVLGLSNTAHVHPAYVTTPSSAHASGRSTPLYGAGPGGSGLTPSQTAGIYGANGIYSVGPRGQGAGRFLAVFELSGYTRSDIISYEHNFFGPAENVPLVDINVDGGPVTPVCPPGDSCGPFGPPPCVKGCNGPDYNGDIEVEADVETQLAIAPRISGILVYNAPNDFTGRTVVDEYMKIAQDDLADSISSSWGLCEQDAGFGQAQAEAIAFQQMAAQGQSIFTSSGDTGAYGCLRGSGATVPAVGDPASQPFVTGVGGTSLEGFDPGNNAAPTYPQGFETVWNVLDLCSGSTYGLTQCANQGASGGGNSIFWGRPAYQYGPGVMSGTTTYAPSCSTAATGQACRETPMNIRRTPSSVRVIRRRTARAPRSQAPSLRRVGSASAGRAYRHRCGPGSSPSPTVSTGGATARQVTACVACSARLLATACSSTTSQGSTRPRTTTACSR